MFLARGFGCSCSQLIILIKSKSFPTNIRSTAIGLAFMISRCCVAVSPFLTQSLIVWLQTSNTLPGIFGSFNSYFCAFHSKDMTNQHMQVLFFWILRLFPEYLYKLYIMINFHFFCVKKHFLWSNYNWSKFFWKFKVVLYLIPNKLKYSFGT